MRTTLAGLTLAAATNAAVGHAGHGAPALHGHAGEGLVALALVAIGALVWWARPRR